MAISLERGAQNQGSRDSKIHQKSIKNGSKNHPKNQSIFGPILNRFWKDFGSQDGSKIEEKSIKKGCQKNTKKKKKQ